ncbi:MAG: hypothetical protein A6F70_08345 [Cycloclasticus sp. symbiont of Bathymodiolus heckerae]|nr:MAG: hypothetical protein A6F70_08345 [Cycloclasticus sp. symbiont of Bathymodiolus heckerae]
MTLLSITKNFNRWLLISLLIVFITSAITLFQTYSTVVETHNLLSTKVRIQQEKRSLLISMYNAARERSLVLIAMLDEKDAFALDDMNQQLGSFARQFITARLALEGLPSSPQEQTKLQALFKLTSDNGLRQREVAIRLMDGNRSSARDLLFMKGIPAQAVIINSMDGIIEHQSDDMDQTLAILNSNLQTSIQNIAIIGTAFFLISLATIFILITRASRQEEKLLRTSLEKEKKASRKMAFHATHDPLTTLWNRRYFEEMLLELKQLTKKNGSQHGLLYIDLDQFKLVNDTAGHEAGDILIQEISTLLKRNIRETDTLARLGGDEFGVLLPNCHIDNAISISETIRSSLDGYQFKWKAANFHIGCSIGIAMMDKSNINDNILSMADIACYNAKESGRNCVHTYKPSDTQVLQREVDMNIISVITESLELGRFQLFAQAITPIQSNISSPTYYEILIRMKSEDGTIVSPDAFIPAAERYGSMPRIDNFVISSAFAWLKAQNNKDLCLSINLSGSSLNSKEFINNFYTQYSHYELAKNICFEITETTTLRNFGETIAFFEHLKKQGFKIALDDFGSGLASFEYLKNLPIDIVKIDGNFVRSIEHNDIDVAMIKAIVDVSHKMNIQTVAEYVENANILSILKGLKVDFAQGYEISKPMPISELSALFTKNKASPHLHIVGKRSS